jgi:clorobiocin biosynthesis protein CloN4
MKADVLSAVLDVAGESGAECAISWSDGRLLRNDLRAAIFIRARALLKANVRHGDRVAICLAKGRAAVELLLACHCIGAVAVPIDVRNPTRRIHEVIKAVSPQVIAIGPELHEALRQLPESSFVMPISDPHSAPIGDGSPLPCVQVAENDLAMIFMSSGSTGVPKGICITHNNISAFVTWAIETFSLTRNDRFISIAPFHFDLSLFDIFASLSVGASVHLLSEQEMLFPQVITKSLIDHSISVVYSVPSVYQMLLRSKCNTLEKLRWLLFAGEVMPPAFIPKLREFAPNAKLANLYGPTETNVVSYHVLERNADLDGTLMTPIGRACDHSQIDLLDEHGAPVMDGEVGEIVVTGPTVMQGYWNAADLTKSVQLNEQAGTLRTGDLGQRDAGGLLHFLGRADHQVKVRGHRVDLAEIEHFAIESGVVSFAAAIVDAPNTMNGKVVLHIVAQDQRTDAIVVVAKHLKRNLPKHCQPALIIPHDSLPSTLSNKIDRRLLASANRLTMPQELDTK